MTPFFIGLHKKVCTNKSNVVPNQLYYEDGNVQCAIINIDPVHTSLEASLTPVSVVARAQCAFLTQ